MLTRIYLWTALIIETLQSIMWFQNPLFISLVSTYTISVPSIDTIWIKSFPNLAYATKYRSFLNWSSSSPQLGYLIKGLVNDDHWLIDQKTGYQPSNAHVYYIIYFLSTGMVILFMEEGTMNWTYSICTHPSVGIWDGLNLLDLLDLFYFIFHELHL